MSQLKVNNITPVAGTTLSISGSLHVRDNITFSGSLTTVGDSSNDAVLFNAGVSSSITPTATNKYDLGTTTKRWKNVFFNSMSLGGPATFASGGVIITGSLTVSSSETFTNLGLFRQTGTSRFTGSIFHTGKGTTHVQFSGSSTTASFLRVVSYDNHVADGIYHQGDLDTSIKFADDNVIFRAGNEVFLTLDENDGSQDVFEINADLADIDFVYNSDNVSNLVTFDGATNAITFNGPITASKNISASNVTANNSIGGTTTFVGVAVNGDSVVIDGGGGHVTASGNISASGTSHHLGNDVTLGDNCTDNINIKGTVTASCNISSSGTITANTFVGTVVATSITQPFTNITASGTISASGTNNVLGNNVTLGDDCTDSITISGQITASCTASFQDISASGAIIGNVGDFTTLTIGTGTTTFSGSVLPANDQEYDLGSTQYQWNVGHITTASVAHIQAKAVGFVSSLTGPSAILVSGNLVPQTDQAWNLGTKSRQFNEGHITSASLAWIYPKPGTNLQISGSTTFTDSVTFNQPITLAGPSASLNLSASGLTITGSLTVSGSGTFSNTGPMNQNGPANITGSLNITKNITSSGTLGFTNGANIYVTGSDLSKGLFIDVAGNITASGNISASITGATGSFGHIFLHDGDFKIGTGNKYQLLPSSGTGRFEISLGTNNGRIHYENGHLNLSSETGRTLLSDTSIQLGDGLGTDLISVSGSLNVSGNLDFKSHHHGKGKIIGAKQEVIAVNSTPFNAQVSSSGAIYIMSSSAGALTFSLPPVVSSSGVTLTLITADNTSHIVSQSSNDSATGRQSKIYGSIQIVTGSTALAGSGSIPVLAQGKITFGSTNGIGQRLEFVGDGTHWYVKGFCNTAPTTAAK